MAMGRDVLRLRSARRSGLLAGTGFVFLLVICAFAYMLLDSQSRVREESENRFQTRAVVSAAMTDSLFATASAQQQQEGAKTFGGRRVDASALAKLARQSRYGYALILDRRGRVLAATSAAPTHVRLPAWRANPHVRAALGGRSHLSGVLPGGRPGIDVIEWAIPFDSRFGRRVQVVAMSPELIAGFLSRYLARGRESKEMDARLVDDDGHLIASADGVRDRLPKQAFAALSKPHGSYETGGTERYFASAPVSGSDWRTVVSQPTKDLYPLLAQGRMWLLWGVLAAFAATAAASLVLFRRTLRTSAQLTHANKRLEKRQLEVAQANESLRQQTRLAEEASVAKSAFLANMSHELRTPLNAIIGFSELIGHNGSETEAERKEYLGHVVASGRHLEKLVNDILDLAKVEAGKLEFFPERVDLAGLIGDLTSTMRVLADKKRIELVTQVQPDVRLVVADPARLKQVLYNYLSNALKFTPEGGRVSVLAEPAQTGSFRLSVEDTGIGIASADQARLFQEFEQVDQTRSKEHQGTGLGLALVKKIVEAQGGEVGVTSTPGEGSVFYAVLPPGEQESQDILGPLPEAVAAPAPPVQMNAAPNVLVVEDDAGDRTLLTEILASAGYVVDTARTGAEGAARARERHFDVVVLDLILPDLSGFDVLRMIREEGKNPTARVIVVTMVKETGLRRAYAVNEWLVKPVDSEQLLAALARVGLRPNCGTVLVIDDDHASRRLAEAAMKQLGCRVVCAKGGEEGLAAAAHDPPAAIVLDLMMPGVDGFQFLERLRSTPAGADIPVIVWTSKDVTVTEQATLLQTAHAFVGKSQLDASLVDELKPLLADVGRRQ